jgi:hypothetical protein
MYCYPGESFQQSNRDHDSIGISMKWTKSYRFPGCDYTSESLVLDFTGCYRMILPIRTIVIKY